MKSHYLFFSLIVLLTLTACDDTTAADSSAVNDIDLSNQENGEGMESSPEEVYLEPPELAIHVGEETINPILGEYSWSIDNEDGTTTTTVVDSATPPELVSTTEPTKVTSDTLIEFDFEDQPDSYTVRLWNRHNTIISESSEVDLAGTGEVICEIVAVWEQGSAGYAFLLTIE